MSGLFYYDHYIMCTKCKVNTKAKSSSWCRDCLNAQHKLWRSRNKDKIREDSKKWMAKSREYRRQYYRDNAEHYRLTNAQYREKNWLRWRLDSVNSNALKKGHIEKLTVEQLERLFSRGCCEDCGSTENLSVGHGIPLCYPTGKNVWDNLILQCTNCNRKQMTRVHVKFANEELRKWYQVYTPQLIQNN